MSSKENKEKAPATTPSKKKMRAFGRSPVPSAGRTFCLRCVVFVIVIFVAFKTFPQTAKLIESYFYHLGKAVKKTHEKVVGLRDLDLENERLRLENVTLRQWGEALRYSCDLEESKKKAEKVGAKLEEETGSEVGRVLASIRYRPPVHLLPDQLYALGLDYLSQTEEVEKAAVIFTFLTHLEENDTFKNARDYLLTGMSWYRVNNYKLADQYFQRVLESSDDQKNLRYKSQARLWRALVAKHTSSQENVQHWLRDLVSHHPHSMEAEWVNSESKAMEVDRAPSSKDHH